MTELKLDIGCGYNPLPGFIGVDNFVDRADIVKADMEHLPYEDASVDYIYSSHALEHIGKYHVVPTLSEWRRVLKPTGRIELRVPDLEWCVKQWLMHGSPADWWLDIIFGNQEHAGEYHRTGFTPKLMNDYLEQAGLKVTAFYVIDSHSQPTMVFIADKA